MAASAGVSRAGVAESVCVSDATRPCPIAIRFGRRNRRHARAITRATIGEKFLAGVYRTVNCEGLIAYRGNRYSVPWRNIGQMLPIRITESELIVHGPHLDEIARHRLFPASASGQTSCREEDRPQEDSRKKHAMLKERFEQLGPSAARFFTALTETRRYGKQDAYKILALLEAYRREDLMAALEHAAHHGAYSSSSVERILAVRATPRTALDRLAEREQGHPRQRDGQADP